MTRRIVCWLTNDPASLAAAKLAIHENTCLADPPPLVVVAMRGEMEAHLMHASIEWLGVPVVVVNKCKAERYRLAGDVHVIGVPVEEQGRYDAFMAAHNGVPVLCVLADRGLTRDDCELLAKRAGVEWWTGANRVLQSHGVAA